MAKQLWFTEIPSPLGEMILAATDRGLRGVYFSDQRWLPTDRSAWERDGTRFAQVREWLKEYYAGGRREYDGQLDLSGTPFQLCVWNALRTIRAGTTASYLQIAAAIGRAKAVRAVGAAIGRNPISLVIPCHRVIGSGGNLTGYAGGLKRKEYLLRLEGANQSNHLAATTYDDQ